MYKIKIMLLALLASVFVAGSVYANKLIIVGEEWAPFEFTENGKVVGIDIDIVDTIMKKIGVEYEVQPLPWQRAWGMIEKGEADATLSTSRKEAREPFLWYPKEDMWVSEYVFFTHKGDKQSVVMTYDEAKKRNLKIGVIRGNSYNDAFWAAFPYQDGATTFQGDKPDVKLNTQLEEATDQQSNFKKLGKKRMDLYLIDKTMGLYNIQLLKLQNEITYYPEPLFSKGYPMPFAKNSKYPDIKKIADRYEEELVKLKKSGEYDKIRDKWLK